jgi:hypothetical protein
MDAPLVISFATRGPYEQHLPRLAVSLEKFGLPAAIEVIEPRPGGWAGNCSYKSAFIRDRLVKYNRPVLWLDADAEVVAPPVLLMGPTQFDFACYLHRENQVLSGTLFLKPTGAVLALMERWVHECEQQPTQWDQKMLTKAYLESSFRPITCWLPPAYCHVYDRRLPPEQSSVILHHQASRALKRIV